MTVRRMDNVGIVVDDLPATIAFFRELGLELEGQAIVEGCSPSTTSTVQTTAELLVGPTSGAGHRRVRHHDVPVRERHGAILIGAVPRATRLTRSSSWFVGAI